MLSMLNEAEQDLCKAVSLNAPNMDKVLQLRALVRRQLCEDRDIALNDLLDSLSLSRKVRKEKNDTAAYIVQQ